jgi:hypothetical protein
MAIAAGAQALAGSAPPDLVGARADSQQANRRRKDSDFAQRLERQQCYLPTEEPQTF